ncbi:MAG: hypothetical protein M3P06_02880 [Acidobacteriota bacterium]|nr:hypothetical protein [Acidobacteriota bacterium]
MASLTKNVPATPAVRLREEGLVVRESVEIWKNADQDLPEVIEARRVVGRLDDFHESHPQLVVGRAFLAPPKCQPH